jgi:acyl carrier protein
VIGTWLLHQLTQEMELDFFVVFSSISSVWGSKGQAHYAAGNAFLDSFAHYRTSSGKRTLSVNWGPWAGGGMTSDEAQALLKRIGVGVVPPERGIAALGYVLQTSAVQITVADVNWPIFRGLYEARGKRSLLELLESSVIDQHRSDQSNLKQRLQAVSQQEAAAILVAYLQAEVGQVLGYNHLPEVDRGFFEMGMDSLMAIDLKARLERDLAVSLPPTIAFESPTIAALAEYLGHVYLGWQSEVPLEHSVIQRAAEREAALSMVEQLADDDLNASIAQELAELELLLQRN